MDYAWIKRSYSHLTNDELQQELHDRAARRYDTRKVGADSCMTDAWVLRACREILKERELDNHDTMNEKEDMKMTYHITMDSFGTECPDNWEEIAEKLNRQIDDALAAAGETPEYGELSDEGREIVDSIWERFAAGEEC